MIDFHSFQQDVAAFIEPEQLQEINAALQTILNKKNGNLERWLPVIENLPDIKPSHIDLNSDTVTIGTTNDCDSEIRTQLENDLRKLSPWRKGPFSLFDIFIDTEWRSDWKWQRVAPHLSPLKDRRILDVGCGSGYHLWRMYGQGAATVAGIDPSLLFLMQFLAVKHFIGSCPVHLLPLGIEHMPEDISAFDTVFSMGVLYHRRSPIDHILQLKSCLRPGGELVLETLVVDDDFGDVLLPKDRYAKMRNVWFIPSCTQLALWLERCGMTDIQLADVSQTSTEEQRATEWMQFESLSDFLDPGDHNKTVEGYPAPKRATFVAHKP